MCGALGVSAQTRQKIGMKKAKTIALQQAKGKIESSELETENGKDVYSFDIHSAKGEITEVRVGAFTGAIVEKKTETKAEERAEKKADRKTARQEAKAKKKGKAPKLNAAF